jgi:outer membrane protein TolC
LFLWLLVTFATFGVTADADAQTQPGGAQPLPVFTLDQAIQYAVDHYPTVRAALEQVAVSTAGVELARTAFLPRLDSVWQSNIATTNNIFGQVFPQSVIPALSGPVLPVTSARGVPGSATGALAAWEAFDFGLRRATVAGAEAAVARARAGEALTRLEVEGAVGSAFLNVVATQRAEVTLQADLERRDTVARVVQTLVDNQLRPGADASRADAERAAARTRLIQAQQSAMLARIALSRILGETDPAITVNATPVLDRIPPVPAPGPATTHPLALVRQASVGVAEAQQRVLARSDFPRVFVQSSLFARGSGAGANGLLSSDLGGLGLDRVNWGAGVQVVFPNLFGFSNLGARKAAAAAATRGEAALYDEAVLAVTSQQQSAAVMVQAARAIAANTPAQLAAARQSETQARARYEAGLAALTEVAEAQSLLTQAEVQDQLARVDIWRALLAEALARGSLTSFLALARP